MEALVGDILGRAYEAIKPLHNHTTGNKVKLLTRTMPAIHPKAAVLSGRCQRATSIAVPFGNPISLNRTRTNVAVIESDKIKGFYIFSTRSDRRYG